MQVGVAVREYDYNFSIVLNDKVTHSLDKHPTMKSKLLFNSYVYALHVFEKKNNNLTLPAFKLECNVCSIQCSF